MKTSFGVVAVEHAVAISGLQDSQITGAHGVPGLVEAGSIDVQVAGGSGLVNHHGLRAEINLECSGQIPLGHEGLGTATPRIAVVQGADMKGIGFAAGTENLRVGHAVRITDRIARGVESWI